ncbi:hypothetical protein [Methylosinus sp. Ce-a6]|uniref:hypothetical protein n=1 Tax=Methylosinus sp. Ce-a6 TaxID=2172005 RepID=UPI001356E422|nr:hypothetical protein [Methylosinus sp. Ce-a6]
MKIDVSKAKLDAAKQSFVEKNTAWAGGSAGTPPSLAVKEEGSLPIDPDGGGTCDLAFLSGNATRNGKKALSASAPYHVEPGSRISARICSG